jgi:hypothetical protein
MYALVTIRSLWLRYKQVKVKVKMPFEHILHITYKIAYRNKNFLSIYAHLPGK